MTKNKKWNIFPFFLFFFFIWILHLVLPDDFVQSALISSHLSLNCEGRWVTRMISQPVSSIFPCSSLPSGTWRTPSLSIPWRCLPTSSSVCLVFFPLLETRPRGLYFAWRGCCGLCFWHKPAELADSVLFCSCVCFCLHGPFNCISFRKFSWQPSAFSLCSSGLISVFFGPFTYVSLYESLLQA